MLITRKVIKIQINKLFTEFISWVGKEEPKHTEYDSALFSWQPCFVRHSYSKFEFSKLILCFLLTFSSFLR